MNFSNTMFADEFTPECYLREHYFMENFKNKIEKLNVDLSHSGIDETLSEDIYLDTIFKEYKNFMKLFEKAFKHTKYPISSRQESKLFSMKGLCQNSKIKVTITYFLTIENLFLFESKSSTIENQLRYIKKDLLDLTYLFVVPNLSVLNNGVIKKLRYMESRGVTIKLTKDTYIGYSRLLLIKDVNFAIFKFKDLVDDPTHLTRHQRTIEKLTIAQKEQEEYSLSLKEFLEKEYPFNGRWYCYNYGSMMEQNDCHEIEVEIENRKVKAFFPSGLIDGEVYINSKQVALVFENSIIKVSILNTNGTIFRTSGIFQDMYINSSDVLSFGICSKERLLKDEVLELLKEIPMREDADYRLKVSDSFARKLAEFKREKRKS